jgi:hypothetical protein
MKRTLIDDIPPVFWSSAIVFLFLLSQWLTDYFGAVTWVRALAGLLATVLVPTLRLLLQDGTPDVRQQGEVIVVRSRWFRWLF